MPSRPALALAAAMLASPALAQTPAEVSYLHANCRAEYTAHCGRFSPHSMAGKSCFRQKARGLADRGQLSRACIASLRTIMARYRVE